MINKNIPTLLGIVSITVGIITGVLLINQKQALKIQAAYKANPQNVRVTNIDNSSFTVFWTTDTKSRGFVKWGENVSTDKVTNSTMQDSTIHLATIKNLTPNTKYSFLINSNGVNFDNNSLPWQVTTGVYLSKPHSSHVLSGKVIDIFGDPIQNAVVFAIVAGGSPLSTTTSQGGNWTITISNSRLQNLATYVPINETKTPIEIIVYTEEHGFKLVKTHLEDAIVSTQIVVGDQNTYGTYNKNVLNSIPKASVKLPDYSKRPSFQELLNSN